jgi:glycosyltransferase involved in cell wall biosynthesis
VSRDATGAGRKKRILWVTYDFPPRQSSGVFRPVKLYKYLDKERYEVDFLTQPLMATFREAVTVEGLLEEMQPRPRIYRPPNYVLDDLLRELFRRRAKPGTRAPSAAPSAPGPNGEATAASRRRAGKAIYGAAIMKLYFPDQFFLWGILATIVAVVLHLRRRYDVVYTTSYPESAHLPGLVLRRLGPEWIADYRYAGALWNKKLIGYPKTKGRERRELRYQRRVLRGADFVVTHSETIGDEFCRRFGLSPSRVRAISNAFDEEDFVDFDSLPHPFEKKPGELHLLHLGVWYLTPAEASRLVEELLALRSAGEGSFREIVLHGVGEDLLADEQLRGKTGLRYVRHGVVPHELLMPYLAAADCYLLSTLATVDEGRPIQGFLPGKLWEYLRGGRPILYVGPDDEPWRIVQRYGQGIYLGLLDGARRLPGGELTSAFARSGRPSPAVGDHSWRSRAAAFEEVLEATLAPAPPR